MNPEKPEAETPEVTPVAPNDDAQVEAQMRQMSRRSFLWSAVALGTTYTGWRWFNAQRQEDGVIWPLRRALQTNEELARDYFKSSRLSPEAPRSWAAANPRVNGAIGLGGDFDPAKWKLQLEGLAAGTAEVSLDEIKKLPAVRMTTQLLCIEGWSMWVDWTGARLRDLMQLYPPATISGQKLDLANNPNDLPEFIGMMTPDGGYYVGLEREAALHPQTLLCYEINGQPLSFDHGAPLRLVIPIKYGVKNIKRIGTIRFSNTRPADYWAEQGYDWYAGH